MLACCHLKLLNTTLVRYKLRTPYPSFVLPKLEEGTCMQGFDSEWGGEERDGDKWSYLPAGVL